MPNNQYFIPKENLARVEEVREIESRELVMPKQQEDIVSHFKERQNLINNKSKLSPAARSKIIKRHGADYLSERAFNHDIALMQMYGPGWLEWVIKTTVVVGGGLVLGPVPAMVVGGVTAGTAKVVENVADDEDVKKVFKLVGDCGGGIAMGGVVGAAAEGAGALLGANEFIGLGSGAGSSAARTASAGKRFTVDGMKLLYTSTERARIIASATHGIKVAGQVEKAISLLKDLGFAGWEAREHVTHVEDGYDYKSWCKVCNA